MITPEVGRGCKDDGQNSSQPSKLSSSAGDPFDVSNVESNVKVEAGLGMNVLVVEGEDTMPEIAGTREMCAQNHCAGGIIPTLKRC